jgi:hypothetical protein
MFSHERLPRQATLLAFIARLWGHGPFASDLNDTTFLRIAAIPTVGRFPADIGPLLFEYGGPHPKLIGEPRLRDPWASVQSNRHRNRRQSGLAREVL